MNGGMGWRANQCKVTLGEGQCSIDTPYHSTTWGHQPPNTTQRYTLLAFIQGDILVGKWGGACVCH